MKQKPFSLYIDRRDALSRSRMQQSPLFFLIGLAVLPLLFLLGCFHGEDPPPVNLVVVGDSLSSGHQHGCTVESLQPYSYAKQMADRFGWPMKLPLLTEPGARPCMVIDVDYNPLTVHRAVDPSVSAGCMADPDPNNADCWGVRKHPTVIPDNLGTPGTRMVDVFASPFDSDFGQFHNANGLDYPAMWGRIIDTPDHDPDMSMAALALDRLARSGRDNNIAIVWLGSNDVLWNALYGGTQAPKTLQSDFDIHAEFLMNILNGASSRIVIANIPDLTIAPQFWPVDDMLALFGSDCASACAALGVTSADKVPMIYFDIVYLILTGAISGPLGPDMILTPTEVTEIQTAVSGYNVKLQELAVEYDAVFVDTAQLLADANSSGLDVGAELPLTTAYCGGIFSLDGIHPTNTGHAAIANAFIEALNAKLGTQISPIDLGQVRTKEEQVNPRAFCRATPPS